MGKVNIKPAEQVVVEQEAAVKQQLESFVQKVLDEKARERNYDSILSLCSYATSLNPKFQAEAQSAVEWRDNVWETCYTLLEEVEAGTREVPTEDELLALLPTLTWEV